MANDLDERARAQEAKLIDSVRAYSIDGDSVTNRTELFDALEGVARTFPFDSDGDLSGIDGLTDASLLVEQTQLTASGLAWWLPTARLPIMFRVTLDDSNSLLHGVRVWFGEQGRSTASEYTSKELRYLEDALRNAPTAIGWAHYATWSRA